MTKEEAIHVINQVRDIITKDPSWMEEVARVVNEAANMAIKALEAQEVSNNSPKLDKENGDLISGKRTEERTETHACDCIERQAAIDALEEQLDYLQMLNKDENPKAESKWHGVNWARNTIADLPSAQPEQRWIPCSERLPDNRVDVLICYRVWQQYAKRYVYAIVNGWYARKHSVNENVFSEWEADCDYKEDEDEFYIHEGWYEFTTQGNGDLMNWYIGGAEVVAWMPLPEPYKEGEEQE